MKEEIIIDLKLDKDEGNFAKLASLKTAITTTKQEAAGLQQAYKKGTITLKEFASESVRLEANQKKLSAAYTDLQRKVTGLKSPFAGLQDQIGQNTAVIDKLIPGLGSATSGIMSMTRAAIAFLATPLGLAIAAIAAGVGAFTVALKTNDEVADEWSVTMSGVSATMDVQLEQIGKLGTAIDKLIRLDFAGFWDHVKKSLDEYNNDATKAVIVNKRLAEEQNKLDDANNDFLSTEIGIRNEIAKLILQSKNRSLSEKERIDLNLKASKLEEDLTNKRINLASRQALIDIQSIATKKQMFLRDNESIQEFGKRVLANSTLIADDQKKVVAAIRAVDEAQSESIAIQEKLQNQRDAIEETAEAKRKARNEKRAKETADINKLNEEDRKKEADKRQKEFQAEEKARLANQDAARKKELEAIQANNEAIDAEAQAQFDRDKKRNEEKADFIKGVFENSLAVFTTSLKQANDIGTALVKSFLISTLRMFKTYIEAKIIGESFATVDSILTLGATGALRIGVLTALVESAFAGLENVIQGFAQGGIVSGTRIKPEHGTPINRSNGDNRIVTVKTDEAILNQKQIARLGGPGVLAKAGVPGYEKYKTGFATGGMLFETQSAFNNATQANALSRLSKEFKELKIAVIIEQVEAKSALRAQIRENANM